MVRPPQHKGHISQPAAQFGTRANKLQVFETRANRKAVLGGRMKRVLLERRVWRLRFSLTTQIRSPADGVL